MPIKWTTTIVGEGQGGKEKEKGKKSERNYRISQNIRIINVFLESLLSGCFPLLGATVNFTFLGCPPTMLVSGTAAGQLRF